MTIPFKRLCLLAVGITLLLASSAHAQRSRGLDQKIQEYSLEIGASGVAWYTTWDSGVKEAKRSNRPIFFMAAATNCAEGISGTF